MASLLISEINTPKVVRWLELTRVIENLNRLELAHSAPERLQPLLDHMVSKIGGTLQKMKDKGSEFKVCGPDWCRENPELAGESHANVIVETYGATYALPNKDPKANVAPKVDRKSTRL